MQKPQNNLKIRSSLLYIHLLEAKLFKIYNSFFNHKLYTSLYVEEDIVNFRTNKKQSYFVHL